jgi:hypothetical protein
MQKVYIYWLMPVCVGLTMLDAYFCQSRLIKDRVYFNNDECKAAFAYSALLVQSVTLIVATLIYAYIYLFMSSKAQSSS